eukprot:6798487-Ditylum_brightwellii.AAC.1
MRCDLRHWEDALKLARSVAPQEVPEISLKFALELDFQGDFAAALDFYEDALSIKDVIQEEKCIAGIARASLHLGDLSRGINMAKRLNDPAL